MKLYLKELKYYYLTVPKENNVRKSHLIKELDEYDLNEVNPINCNTFRNKLTVDEKKRKSGATGFLKIIDLASQNMGTIFKPFCILEDDIAKYRDLPNCVDIPDNCDILYTGLSTGSWVSNKFINNQVYYQNIKSFDHVIQVYNMLSTHSMIICSIRGMLCLQKCLMDDFYKNRGWDISITEMQPHLNVLALKEPLFYQSKHLNGVEHATKINYKLLNNKPFPPNLINKKNVSIITNYN